MALEQSKSSMKDLLSSLKKISKTISGLEWAITLWNISFLLLANHHLNSSRTWMEAMSCNALSRHSKLPTGHMKLMKKDLNILANTLNSSSMLALNTQLKLPTTDMAAASCKDVSNMVPEVKNFTLLMLSLRKFPNWLKIHLETTWYRMSSRLEMRARTRLSLRKSQKISLDWANLSSQAMSLKFASNQTMERAPKENHQLISFSKANTQKMTSN